MELSTFIERVYTLADLRNLSSITAVNVVLQHNTKDYIICVSWREPSQTTYPFNVLWLNADSESIYFKQLRIRVSDNPTDGFTNTWHQITNFDDIFAEVQYYRSEYNEYVENSPFEPLYLATTDLNGKFKLTVNNSDATHSAVAVGDNDPRMSDARNPLEHEHPLESLPPASLIDNINSIITLDPAKEPSFRKILKITNFDTFGWDYARTNEIGSYVPKLVSIGIVSNIESMMENESIKLQVRASYSDSSSANLSRDLIWSVDNDAVTVLPDGTVVGGGNLTEDVSVIVSVEYTQPGTGIRRTTLKPLLVKDRIYPIAMEFVLDAALNDNSDYPLEARVTYSDNSNAVITDFEVSVPQNSQTIAKIIDGRLFILDVVGNKTISLDGTYEFNNRTVSTSAVFTIVDSDPPQPVLLTIIGADAIDGGNSEQYIVTATMSDGNILTVDATLTLSGSDASLEDGRIDTLPCFETHNLVLDASWTDQNVTKHVSKTIEVVPNNIPASVVIVGPDSVNENSNAVFSAKLLYSNGLEAVLNSTLCTWTVNSLPAIGSIANGVYTAPSGITANITEEIKVEHTLGASTFTATKQITLVDTAVYPVAFRVKGKADIGPNASQMYAIEYSMDYSSWQTNFTWPFVLSAVGEDGVTFTFENNVLSGVSLRPTLTINSTRNIVISGSITFDGKQFTPVSLTVVASDTTDYLVAVIPETKVLVATNSAAAYSYNLYGLYRSSKVKLLNSSDLSKLTIDVNTNFVLGGTPTNWATTPTVNKTSSGFILSYADSPTGCDRVDVSISSTDNVQFTDTCTYYITDGASSAPVTVVLYGSRVVNGLSSSKYIGSLLLADGSVVECILDTFTGDVASNVTVIDNMITVLAVDSITRYTLSYSATHNGSTLTNTTVVYLVSLPSLTNGLLTETNGDICFFGDNGGEQWQIYTFDFTVYCVPLNLNRSLVVGDNITHTQANDTLIVSSAASLPTIRLTLDSPTANQYTISVSANFRNVTYILSVNR